MKTPTQIKREIKKSVLAALLNANLSPTKAAKESITATELIMETIKPYLKKKEFNGGEIKRITDWYWILYKNKLGIKPVWDITLPNTVKGMIRSKDPDMEVDDWINFLKTASYIFLYEDEDPFPEKTGYKLGLLSRNLSRYRLMIDTKMKQFKLSQSDYYRKYVGDICGKLHLSVEKYGPNTEHPKQNKQED